MKYIKTYENYDIVLESKFTDAVKDIIDSNRGNIKATILKFKSYISNMDTHARISLIKHFMICMLSIYGLNKVSKYLNVDKIENNIKQEVVQDVNDVQKSFSDFLHAVGKSESSNRWNIRKGQYLGYFQLGKLALKDIGLDYHELTRNDKFLKDKDLQIECFTKLLNKNRKYLKKYIEKYNGTEINGIKITESGILMAAHLVGYKNVKKYFKSNGKQIAKDGNGVPLTEYLNKFSGYEIPK